MNHRRRSWQVAAQALYCWELNPQERKDLLAFPWLSDQEIGEEVRAVAVLIVGQWQQQQLEVDQLIADHLINWHFSRLYPVDRSLLRLGTCLLLNQRQLPVALILNEIIELAKRLGCDNSHRLINGVLNKIAGWIDEKGSPTTADSR